jgi:hypothetical protein
MGGDGVNGRSDCWDAARPPAPETPSPSLMWDLAQGIAWLTLALVALTLLEEDGMVLYCQDCGRSKAENQRFGACPTCKSVNWGRQRPTQRATVPAVEWALTQADRVFLRVQRILVDEDA